MVEYKASDKCLEQLVVYGAILSGYSTFKLHCLAGYGVSHFFNQFLSVKQ